MLTKKREQRPTSEASAITRDSIFRLLGVRLTLADLGNLDPAEASELVALTRKIENPDTGNNVNNLSPAERKRWEALVEGAAQLAPGFFADRRRQDDTERTLAEMERKARLPRREKWEAPVGSVVLLADDLMTYLDRPDPALEVVDLGVLVLLASQIANAKALSPGARLESDGDSAALVLDRGLGIGGKYDPDGRIGNSQRIIEHLSRNGWLAAERVGNETHVRLGARLLKAARGAN